MTWHRKESSEIDDLVEDAHKRMDRLDRLADRRVQDVHLMRLEQARIRREARDLSKMFTPPLWRQGDQS